MQDNDSRLKIHTSVRPEQDQETERAPVHEDETQKEPEIQTLLKEVRPRRRIRRRKPERQGGDQMTVGEKLVRNTAVACALLLTAMAVKNVDHPWTQKAAEGIRQAMTMRVDWDETLGRLSFVRALVPDTALVFLNLGQKNMLSAPVQGDVSHSYTEQQPWLEYRCEAGQAVFSAMSGTVSAIGQGVDGDWTVLVADEEGRETVYGYLGSVFVEVGQKLKPGQQIGQTGQADPRLYFELREMGESADPSARMK